MQQETSISDAISGNYSIGVVCQIFNESYVGAKHHRSDSFTNYTTNSGVAAKHNTAK
jgi:hypothetical protein